MIIGHPTAGPDLGGLNSARRPTRLTDKALDIVPTPMLPSTGSRGETSSNVEYDIWEEGSVGSRRVFGELDGVGVTGELYSGGGKRVRVMTPLSGTESDSVLVEGLL